MDRENERKLHLYMPKGLHDFNPFSDLLLAHQRIVYGNTRGQCSLFLLGASHDSWLSNR
jgi:hypothetical protein